MALNSLFGFLSQLSPQRFCGYHSRIAFRHPWVHACVPIPLPDRTSQPLADTADPLTSVSPTGDLSGRLAAYGQAISAQGAHLGSHEQMLRAIAEQQASHDNMLREIFARLQSPGPAPTPTLEQAPNLSTPQTPPIPPQGPIVIQETKLGTPAPGQPGRCKGFITQCSLVFDLQPSMFSTDGAQVAYIISLLSDKALSWSTALWEKQTPACADSDLFMAEMRKVFDHDVSGQEAAKRLLRLRQGPSSVAEFSIKFRTLAAESGWNKEALVSTSCLV